MKNLKSQNSKLKAITQILKVLKFLVIVLTFNICVLSLPSPAYADVKIGEKFGFGGITSLGDALSRLVTPGFSIAAVAVIIYFLMGAFKFLTSGGNKEEVAAARAMITHAIIGFMILIFSFLILQFLLSALFGITGFQLFKS